MLPLAILGIFLWVLLLLWRYNTAAVSMPVKEEEAGPRSAAALGDFHEVKPSYPGGKLLPTVSSTSPPRDDDETETETETSSTSGSPETEASDSDTQAQASPEVNSDKPPLPPSAEKPLRACAPMLSSGPEVRERLKFILGASEDYSSDEEHVATKPPSGASQPPTPNCKPSAQTKSSPAGIK